METNALKQVGEDPKPAEVKTLDGIVERLEARVLRLRSERDQWENMHRIQGNVNEATRQLAEEQKGLISSLRVKAVHLEQFLDMIPGCSGDVLKAQAWIRAQALTDGARSARAVADQVEHKQECRESKPESLCVAEVKVNHSCDRTEVWCNNCQVMLATMGDRERLEHGLVTPQAVFEFLRNEWEAHVASKSPIDNLAGAGVGSSLAAASPNAAEPASANPTGARFPHGRYAGREKGGV
jgi:hypothetical protein